MLDWYDLCAAAEQGVHPVVIPTATAPLVGAGVVDSEMYLRLCYSPLSRHRAMAALWACAAARYSKGMSW